MRGDSALRAAMRRRDEADALALQRGRFLITHLLRRRLHAAGIDFDAEQWAPDRRHDLWTLIIIRAAEPILQISFFRFELRYAVFENAERLALKRKLDAAIAAIERPAATW